MSDSTIFILCLIVCICGCILSPGWIKTSTTLKWKIRSILCFITFSLMAVACCWGILYDNNLLWYGQHKANAHIEMNIDSSRVEGSSFIYLIEQLGPDTSVDDVINIMGTNYEASTDGGYELEYTTSSYTVDGIRPTSLTFKFNKRKTKILSIKWSYRTLFDGMFEKTLNYLETSAFGTATTSSETKATWRGLHLEDTGYYLLLIREF